MATAATTMSTPALALIGADGQIERSTESFSLRYDGFSELGERSPEIERVLRGQSDSEVVEIEGVSAEVRPVVDSAGMRHALLTLVGDPAQPQAQEANALLEIPLDDSPALVWIKDSSGRYLRANRRHAELLGRTAEKLLGKTDAELPTGATVDGPRLAQAGASDGEPLQLAYIVTPFESRPALSVLRFAVHGADGEVLGSCGVAAPVSESRLAEQEALRLMDIERRSRLDAGTLRAELLTEWGVAAGHGQASTPSGEAATPHARARPAGTPAPAVVPSEPRGVETEAPVASPRTTSTHEPVGDSGVAPAELLRLQVELREATARADALRDALEASRSELGAFRAELEVVRQLAEGAGLQARQSGARVDGVETQAEQARSLADRAEADLVQLRADADQAQARVKDLEAGLKGARSDAQAAGAEAAAAREQAEIAREQVGIAREDAELARGDAKAIGDQLATARKDAKKAMTEVEAARDDARRALEDARDARGQVIEARGETADGRAAAEQAASRATEARALAEQTAQDLAEVRTRAEQTTWEIGALRLTAEQSGLEIVEVRTAAEEARAGLDEVRGEAAAARTDARATQERQSALELGLEELRAELTGLQHGLQTLASDHRLQAAPVETGAVAPLDGPPQHAIREPAPSWQRSWTPAAQRRLSTLLGRGVDRRAARREALEVIGTGMGWDAAALWRPDPRGMLRCVSMWSAEGVDGSFERATLAMTGGEETALGKAFYAREAVVLARLDESADPRRRLAAEHGFAAGLLMALSGGVVPVGVLELLTRRPDGIDTALVKALETIAPQIATLIAGR
jgi:PAS domain-containing protein